MVMEAQLDGKRVVSPGLGADVGDLPAAEIKAGRAGRAAPLPPELHPLLEDYPRPFLEAIARRARQIGAGGDEVLRCAGLLSRGEATARLATHLGVREITDPAQLPQPPEGEARGAWARAVLRTGILAGSDDTGLPWFTMAVEGRAVRRLTRALRIEPALKRRLRLVSPDRLRTFVTSHAWEAISHEAAFGFRDAAPDKSAGTLRAGRALLVLAGLVLMALALGSWLSAAVTVLAVQGVLSIVFLAWCGLRLAGCAVEASEPPPARLPEDRELPVYSVLIPLYKEAEIVPRLVEGLKALDYPPEKLDIKLVVEADDALTRAAIATLGLPAHMEEVAVAPVGPCTKPKALNAALALTRGSYVAVYDAEDQPEPAQLRLALAEFRRSGPRVACVQARLCIENGADSWISGHFAAEYAGQFDVLLPILSTLNLPILLGGTSNHFRRDVLERLGGWDPFNVTEDADLGVRLVRAGWATRVISSTTYEEAPTSRRVWLGQRARWLKGWAQTLLVHGRHPRTLLRDLGWRSTTALLVLTAGPYASALVHPFCMAVLVWQGAQGLLGVPCASVAEVMISALTYTTLAVGYAGTALSMAVGLARRGERVRPLLVATIPIYWLLLSLAAWRAVFDLVLRPHHWEKTQHGASTRPSRFAPQPMGHASGSGEH